MAIIVDNARRTDPVKPGRRLRVRIQSSARGTYVPGNNNPAIVGTNEFTIYQDDLDRVEGLVEKRLDLIDQAKAAHESLLRQEIITKSKMPAEVVDMWLDGQPVAQDAADRFRKIKARYTGSWQAEFYELTRRVEGAPRGRMPFDSVEVIEEMPPALEPQAEMMRDLLHHVNRPQDAGLAAEVAALRQELAEIKASKQKKAKAGKREE